MREGLSASLEDYLEVIFVVLTQKQAARAKDIAERLKVAACSVTGALRSLAGEGLIHYAPNGLITLTDEGRRLAEDVVHRHQALRNFFIKVLGVEEQEADAAACRMEHAIARTILERFIKFAEWIDHGPQEKLCWVDSRDFTCGPDPDAPPCQLSQPPADERPLPSEEPRPARETSVGSPVPMVDLPLGCKARIARLRLAGASRKRLLEMGLTPGAVIEIERLAPLGDPIDIKVKGYHLSLRKEDACQIEVEDL